MDEATYEAIFGGRKSQAGQLDGGEEQPGELVAGGRHMQMLEMGQQQMGHMQHLHQQLAQQQQQQLKQAAHHAHRGPPLSPSHNSDGLSSGHSFASSSPASSPVCSTDSSQSSPSAGAGPSVSALLVGCQQQAAVFAAEQQQVSVGRHQMQMQMQMQTQMQQHHRQLQEGAGSGGALELEQQQYNFHPLAGLPAASGQALGAQPHGPPYWLSTSNFHTSTESAAGHGHCQLFAARRRPQSPLLAYPYEQPPPTSQHRLGLTRGLAANYATASSQGGRRKRQRQEEARRGQRSQGGAGASGLSVRGRPRNSQSQSQSAQSGQTSGQSVGQHEDLQFSLELGGCAQAEPLGPAARRQRATYGRAHATAAGATPASPEGARRPQSPPPLGLHQAEQEAQRRPQQQARRRAPLPIELVDHTYISPPSDELEPPGQPQQVAPRRPSELSLGSDADQPVALRRAQRSVARRRRHSELAGHEPPPGSSGATSRNQARNGGAHEQLQQAQQRQQQTNRNGSHLRNSQEIFQTTKGGHTYGATAATGQPAHQSQRRAARLAASQPNEHTTTEPPNTHQLCLAAAAATGTLLPNGSTSGARPNEHRTAMSDEDEEQDSANGTSSTLSPANLGPNNAAAPYPMGPNYGKLGGQFSGSQQEILSSAIASINRRQAAAHRNENRKCRKVYGMDRRDLWCTQCKWKKACSRFCDQ